MNLLHYLRRRSAIKRLTASLRPDPAYREHRLAQFSPARRERYWRNALG